MRAAIVRAELEPAVVSNSPLSTQLFREPLVIETISTYAELLALKREWRELEVEAQCELPFATWDWAVSWWTHLRSEKWSCRDSLHINAIRAHSGRLVAIAPMVLTERPAAGPLRVRELHFLGPDPNITEIRGMLSVKEFEVDAYHVFIEEIESRSGTWDWVVLNGVPGVGAVNDAVTAKFPHSEASTITDFCLELPATWEQFRSNLSRNIKESLRKCYNSLKRDGRSFELEVVRSPSGVKDALGHFYRLHEARSMAEGTVRHRNVFDSAKAREFLSDVCCRFAARDALRVFLLRIDGQVSAARVGFLSGKALYLYYSGYDQALAKYSVMTTAVAEAIKYAIAEGCRTVNLSIGRDISKTRWNPGETVYRDHLIISNSWRSRLAHGVHQRASLARAGDGIGSMLARLASRDST